MGCVSDVLQVSTGDQAHGAEGSALQLFYEYRKRGIATHLIRGLQSEASGAGIPLVLHVDKGNLGAKNLYAKLGFAATGETEFSIEMKWTTKRG